MLQHLIRCSKVLVFLLAFGNVQAQEYLAPLEKNPMLMHQKRTVVQEGFIYAIDTLTLPILDDFSTDKFKKYNAKPGDSNVSDSLFYELYIAGIPAGFEHDYQLDTSYLKEVDYDAAEDTVFTTQTPLPSVQVEVKNLGVYPNTSVTLTMWPSYTILDTLYGTPESVRDTVYGEGSYDQDSTRMYFVEADNQSIWVDSYVYRNHHYPINPPTFGVATFDGLDEVGEPYDFSSNAYGVADYLTSKPIDLAEAGLQNIYFSFYYQPKGNGGDITVQPDDSLVLEFYSPIDSTWNQMWSSLYHESDVFAQEIFPVVDPRFLAKGFKFRFKNFGSLNGSLDHWHIDYVFLGDQRTPGDTLHDDLAFQYPAQTLLSDYTAVPWKHYQVSPESYMKDTMFTYSKNLDDQGKIVNDSKMLITYEGVLMDPHGETSIGFSNIGSEEEKIYRFPVRPEGTVFDTQVNDTCASFEVKAFHGTSTGNDLIRSNDTAYFKQVFEDYYAYDDGTAEAAYGVNSSTIFPQIALQFNSPLADSLKGIQIYFNPVVEDATQLTFKPAVWTDLSQDAIYTQLGFETPRYGGGVNKYQTYMFDEKVAVNGTFFVGVKQTGDGRINIGWDKNTSSEAHVFYKASGDFKNTSFVGSLMIRPLFVSDKDALIGIEEYTLENAQLHPNPSTGFLFCDQDEVSQVSLYDMTGRMVATGQVQNGLIDFTNQQHGFTWLFFKIETERSEDVKKLYCGNEGRRGRGAAR